MKEGVKTERKNWDGEESGVVFGKDRLGGRREWILREEKLVGTE